jgi:hypothetical protein
MKKSAAQYVWIFDDSGVVVGIWATSALMSQSNRVEILRMAVAERASAAKAEGKTLEDFGFGSDVFTRVAEQRWRQVPNGRTEMNRGTAFGGGAFLMFDNAPAPNEVQDSSTAYEVRETGGVHGLIQLRPVAKKRPWWQFWAD